MKITFFIGSISGGGAERVVCNLSNYLTGKGHDVSVLTIGKADNAYGLDERVKVISLEGKKRIKFYPLRVLVKMLKLKKRLKNSDADLFVVFLPEALLAFFHYKKYVKSPVIFTESVDPESCYSPRLIKRLANCLKKSDGAVFLSTQEESFYKSKTIFKSGIVIPNAVNAEFNKPPFSGERKKTIVGVGRHTEQKNFPLLINAFSDVIKEFPDYTLEIYGKGELTGEYIGLCKKLGIEDKVVFKGFCENLQDEIYDAGLFVLSSDYEGIPVAMIEAMALGLPCVSTDCAGGGASFLIKDGENGLLVPVNDKKRLADAIKSVLSDEDKAKYLGKNAAKIKETLSSDKIYAQWENYFNGIVNKNEI